MFDLGWTEIALIAVVAVVVIGPKELPKVMREIGQWVARARALSRNFMEQLDEMSRDTGLDQVRKDVQSIGQIDPKRAMEKTIDPDGVIERQMADLEKIGMPLEPPLPKPEPGGEMADFVPPEAEATRYIDPEAEPSDQAKVEPETGVGEVSKPPRPDGEVAR